MAITRSQMARQLFALGGLSDEDDNLRSLGLGMLGAPLTDIAPAGILGTGSMVAGDINRPTSGYETEKTKEEKDKAFEELEKEGLFKDLGIDPKDLRSQQMKEIENQLALGPISIGTGIYGAVKSAGGIGAFLKNMAKQKAGKELTKKTIQGIMAADALAAEKQRLEMMYGSRDDDPGTTGGSSRDDATGGTFGSSVDDASTFSDYS